MKYFLLAALLILGPAATVHADGKDAPTSQDLMYFSDNGPVLLRLQIEIDGKPAQEFYRKYLNKWFAHLDRDGDGLLDAQELGSIPKGNYLVSLFRYGYVPPSFSPNAALKMSDLGKAEDAKVSVNELAEYLEKFSISAVQPALKYGSANQKSPFNELLFKMLDTDGDGKLSKKEATAARKLLLKFDLNDDELITQQELVGNTVPNYGVGFAPPPPGGAGMYKTVNTSLYLLNGNSAVAGNSVAQLAALILARYDKDKAGKLDLAESGLDQATFQKLDRDENGFLTVTEVMHWNEHVPPISVTLRIGAMAGNQPRAEIATPAGQLPKNIEAGKTGPDQPYLLLNGSKISFQGVSPSPQMMKAPLSGGAGGYLLNLFKVADKQNKGFVQANDLIGNQFKQLANAFPVMDRNADGKLTQAELEDYLNLVYEARFSYASVHIAEATQDLFQVLDLNRDGKLSLHELIHAWDHLSVLDRNKDGFITPDEFSQQYTITVGQGQVNVAYNPAPGGNPLALPPGGNKVNQPGPLWFQKMDINGDGHVSAREFLGTREQFEKLDTNNDGLISPDEAQQALVLFPRKDE